MRDTKKTLTELTKEEILALDPADFSEQEILSGVIIAWAKTLGCYWKFKGTSENPDVHAILKAKTHSNEFFYIREMLEYENIRKIIAWKLAGFIQERGKNVFIAGIPKGASKLAKDIAEIAGLKYAEMQKDENERIRFVTELPPDSVIIFVEDVSTRRTAVRESYREAINVSPGVRIVRYILAVIDRAKSKAFDFFIYNDLAPEKPFMVKSLVTADSDEWAVESGEVCPLCQMGSKPMKPKTPAENWKYFQ